MCLLHLSGCHLALAAHLPSDIGLAIFGSKVYGLAIVVSPLASGTTFAWWCASSFLGIQEYPGSHSISGLSRWEMRAWAALMIHLASRCPSPGTRCAVNRMAACESLRTATIFTPCLWQRFSLFNRHFERAGMLWMRSG